MQIIARRGNLEDTDMVNDTTIDPHLMTNTMTNAAEKPMNNALIKGMKGTTERA